MRKLSSALFASFLLTAATHAGAAIVFENISRFDLLAPRTSSSSPLAAITVSAPQQLNQIAVYIDPFGNANLKFLVFNLDTGSMLFSTAATSVADAGPGYYLSAPFAPLQLSPGINYGIGAIADTFVYWGVNNASVGNPFTQGGFTASDDRNGNVLNYSAPALELDGGAMVIVQLGTVAVPEPGTMALIAAGLAMLGGFAARSRQIHERPSAISP